GVSLGVYFLFFSSSGPGPELKYLPDNPQLIAKVQVQDLLNSKAYKQINEEFGDLMKAGPGNLDDMQKEIGLKLKDIKSILVGGEITDGKEPTIVVRTVKSVKDSDILSNLKDIKFTDAKVGKYTVHESANKAFCVAESDVVVYGSPDIVKKVLKR